MTRAPSSAPLNLGNDLFGEKILPPQLESLALRFGVPPFSVLNARDGWWQSRKAAWRSLGIASELGRTGYNKLSMSQTIQGLKPSADQCAKHARSINLQCSTKDGECVSTTGSATSHETGTSIFDPVLCELAYRWFSPPGGLVLDPFAGGSVRGIVAHQLGRRYHGIELRPEQVKANEEQKLAIVGARDPSADPDSLRLQWRTGDSEELLHSAPRADFLFSCPPYGDLEVYSDDPRDLSTMDYPEFSAKFARIVNLGAERLLPNRFACFVVGDWRNSRGAYCGFVADTIAAFARAGLELWNHAILVTMVGSLSLRAASPFANSRKLGKTHQDVLVFVKGDGKLAAKACGPCEYGSETA